jgi:hypothetical protein
VAVDAHGDLLIDSVNSVVEEVTPAGSLSVIAGVAGKFGPPTPGPATSSEFGGPANRSDLDGPFGVAVDGHGDLFIADEINSDVEKVTF